MRNCLSRAETKTRIAKVCGAEAVASSDVLATEEPLEIRIAYGPRRDRQLKSIAVTMRTPGDDLELAVGFLTTEGILQDPDDIEKVVHREHLGEEAGDPNIPLTAQRRSNVIQIELAPDVHVNLASVNRNFYTTSSCGICGKASLIGLQTVSPPRVSNQFSILGDVLCSLPNRLRQAQSNFDRTGGLHGAGLFAADGEMISTQEDVGRHNAVDKLIGEQFLQDRLPLRNAMLLLSGRVSFELLQKAVMGGIPMVAAIGAPSSLAVEVARYFDVVLVGFLRGERFNIYHGEEHISGVSAQGREMIEAAS